MTGTLTAPFFEIGPKNLLRRGELEELARVAGAAGARSGVTVVLTVPSAMVAPLADLRTGVLVLAQSMDSDEMGPSFGRVTAEALVDAGADGVMLNHDAAPLDHESLVATLQRARTVGLSTIVCAGTAAEAVSFAALGPTAVLLEPAELIGTAGIGQRAWIPAANESLRQADPTVLTMHAGGVATPEVARSIMAMGADGTGSTSGVLAAPDPLRAAEEFIAAAREGWDHPTKTTTTEHITRSES